MIITAPLVSVCMPTCNGERFLEEALYSVLHQTYRPLEMVVSDDHSSDRTLSIVERVLAAADCDWRVYRHQPQGMVQNWNFCVKQAKGEFIKFLFQDDRLTPDCVAEMVSLAQQDEKIGMVFCRRGLLIEKNLPHTRLTQRLIHGSTDVHRGWGDLRSVQPGKALLGDPQMLSGNLNKIGEPSCVLLRKDVFSQIGEFNPSCRQLVDLEFWYRVMMRYNVGFVHQELAQFRIHLNQQSFQNHTNGQASEDWKAFFYWLWTGPVRTCLHPKAKRFLHKKCLRLGVLPGRSKPYFYRCVDFLTRRFPSCRPYL